MCEQLDPATAAMSPLPVDDGDERLIINADQGVLEQGGLSSLDGGVTLRQGGKEFTAQSLDYDDSTQQIHVRKESLFRNPNFIVRSQRVDFDLNTETGVFSDTTFTLPERAARGDASIITLESSGVAEFRLARYTTCAPGSDAWYLEARSITLDHEEGLGTADNARINFLGVPVLYLPYFRFPIDDRRRTGLLFPTVGQSSQVGFDMRWPVYVNLAPNYDLTLTPRVMTTRGLQLGSDTRYLLDSGRGHLRYDYLNHDTKTGDARGFVEFEHTGLINQRLSLESHLAEVSDRQYFEDLGGSIDAAATPFLDRSVLLTYQAPSAYVITVLAQDYQPIASNVLPTDEPYRRLPQVQLKTRTKNSLLDTRAGFAGEYTNFQRASDTQALQGQRLTLQPYLLMEKERNTWFFTSEASLNSTYYLLSNTTAGGDSEPSRTLPQFSAGSGLRFERLTPGGNLQTLEPQLFYLYTPYRDQDDLPVFDSGEPDFDFSQLFARNRYSGEDRVSDANHLALALTSRLLDPDSGVQRVSASIGQLYRFQAPRVQLPNALNTPPPQGTTDFIASVDYQLSSRWNADVTAQWSPDSGQFNRSSVAVHYRDDGRRIDLGYRYRENLLEQTDAAVSLPLGSSWRVTGRSRYSLRDKATIDNLLGVEYSTCCWAIQTSYRRYIANTRGDYDSGIYLQLNLKGLARLGNGFVDPDSLDQRVEGLGTR